MRRRNRDIYINRKLNREYGVYIDRNRFTQSFTETYECIGVNPCGVKDRKILKEIEEVNDSIVSGYKDTIKFSLYRDMIKHLRECGCTKKDFWMGISSYLTPHYFEEDTLWMVNDITEVYYSIEHIFTIKLTDNAIKRIKLIDYELYERIASKDGVKFSKYYSNIFG